MSVAQHVIIICVSFRINIIMHTYIYIFITFYGLMVKCVVNKSKPIGLNMFQVIQIHLMYL